MNIKPLFSAPSLLYTSFQSLSWKGRTIALIAASSLALFLAKKIYSYYSKPSAPVPPKSQSVKTEQDKLTTYLNTTLKLETTKDFSEKLGTQLKKFSERGLVCFEDLQALDLPLFSEKLIEFKEEAAKLIIDEKSTELRRINGEISSLLTSIQEFIEDSFITQNKSIQDICASHALIAFDLSEDIETLNGSLKTLKNTCSKACTRAPQLQKNKTALDDLLRDLENLDRKRQIVWLKAYLLQQDLLKFWSSQQNKSLSAYKGVTEGITTADLFQLGFRTFT